MKKVVSILAAAAVCMTMLSGCSRTVSPGDIEGYDEGEIRRSARWLILMKKPAL